MEPSGDTERSEMAPAAITEASGKTGSLEVNVYEVVFLSLRKPASPVSTREQAVESSDDDYSSSHIGASATKPKKHSLPVFSPPLRLTVRVECCELPDPLQQRSSNSSQQSLPQCTNRHSLNLM